MERSEALSDGHSPLQKRGRAAPKLAQQLERINALSKPKQRAVMEVLDAMIAQASESG